MKAKKVYKDIMYKMLFFKVLKVGIIVTVLCYAWAAYDDCVANSNAYNTNCPYQTVYVSNGDTVWSIAAKYTDPQNDIRATVMAIKQLNRMSNDVAIYPGQSLKVPKTGTL